MAATVMTWLVGIPLLGLATGMRTMTPIAVCCWFARLGLLPVRGTWAAWTASPVAVGVFSIAAIAEYVADKHPKAGPRTATVGLLSRIVFAGLIGAIVATSLQNSIPVGASLSIIAAVVGAFGGFMARRDLVRNFRCRDWPVALLEDFVAILLSVFAMRLVTT